MANKKSGKKERKARNNRRDTSNMGDASVFYTNSPSPDLKLGMGGSMRTITPSGKKSIVMLKSKTRSGE